MRCIAAGWIVLAVMCCGLAFGEVPSLINYQGRLNDADGQPVNGTVVLGFGFYGRPDPPPMGEDNMRRYYEEQNVEVADGIFNVLIGNGVNRYGSFDAIASDDPVYLQIFVNPSPTRPVAGLMPRQRIGSVAFALRAGTSDALETRVAALEGLLAHFTRNGNDIYIDGANLHIRNKMDATETTNGLGNLIVGYNEERGDGTDDRAGSHNIVVGKQHRFASYGGLVAGRRNTISGPYACVSGGYQNAASYQYSSVSGGEINWANGHASFVSGGYNNTADGQWSSVSGGRFNRASGDYSRAAGGYNNAASGNYSSISGGYSAEASGEGSSVSGGQENEAIGKCSSVSGGEQNKARGDYSSVTGGYKNNASDSYSSVSGGEINWADSYASCISGGYNNTTKGRFSSVSGGRFNRTDGDYATVGGGWSRVSEGDYDWRAGTLFEDF